jgi:large subunit ribosomal protein L25
VADQIRLEANRRERSTKGAVNQLRRDGRVPGIMYGYKVDPTPVDVDALELYHALHTEAGMNALLLLTIAGDDEQHLTVARDMQRHPVRRDTLHVDFLAVDKDSPISVEVPVHTINEDDAEDDQGVLNQILYTVPILVRPLDVPNYFELDLTGLAINDVRRVEDLSDQLPEGAEFDIDLERTVLTVNAPISEEELEAMEEEAGQEAEEPEVVGEEEADEEAAEDAEGAQPAAEGAEDGEDAEDS